MAAAKEILHSTIRAGRSMAIALSKRSVPQHAPSSSMTRTLPIRTISTSHKTRAAQSSGTDLADLEGPGFFEGSVSDQPFDPAGRARGRRRQLPSSRYKFRSPRYYRGPLHPHQPLPKTDPASREFIPGPFSFPRAQATYNSTFEADLMTLAYAHFPPGYEPYTKPPRLRSWDDSSPYHAGRGLRAPRGPGNLRPLTKPINFRNVPKLTGITVHSFVQGAGDGSAALHVAGMALQAITGVRALAHQAKTSVSQWNIRAGKYMSLTCELKGEDMYHFLAKTVDVVMPRIKDWRGVKGSSGDSTGNITFGFTPDIVAYYPEIEINYDSYPPKMIPGCHITVRTSTASDKEARLLLSTMGIPFYGKLSN